MTGAMIRSTGAPPAPRIRDTPRAPLSYAQERLWFVDVAEAAGGSSYNVPLLLRWRGRVDPAALAVALAALVERHETLRTVYQVDGGEPVQVIQAARPVGVALMQVAAEPSASSLTEVARRPFDLTAEQPIRCTVWRAPQRDLVLLTFHHIAIDGWSLAPLFTELAAAYEDASNGTAPPGASRSGPASLRFADLAAWERESDNASRGLAERSAHLAPAESAVRLAVGETPSGAQVRDGARPGADLRFDVPERLWRRVVEVGAGLRATPFVVLLAAYQEVLRRWSGVDDFLIGSIMANRPHRSAEHIVGFFANTVPLRCRPRPEVTFAELCRQTRLESYRALSVQGLPLHHLAADVATRRGSGRAPLVTVGFALQNMPVAQAAHTTRWERPELLPSGTARFDLMMILEESGGAAAGAIEYDPQMYSGQAVRAFADGFLTLLDAAVAAPETLVAALPLTRAQAGSPPPGVLTGPDPVEIDGGVPASVLPSVGARLAVAPGATAVTWSGGRLDRGELDAWSAAVAGALAAAGIGAADNVAVLAGRGGPLVAGWLATLRAGAAYLALDLDTPLDRLRDILRGSAARTAVVDAAGASRLAELGLPLTVFDLDTLRGTTTPGPAAAPPGGEQPAVVFHTSGTTGTPKGVVVPHRGLVNSVAWWASDAALTEDDRVLCAVGSGFDPCTFEVLRCLHAGAELVFADDVERRDGSALAALLAGCTVAAMTPTLARAILDAADAGDQAKPVTRLLYLGGEPLTRALVTRIRRTWPDVEVRNLYGPTEASCNATSARWEADDESEPAIGLPVAGTRAYVLGPAGEELPAGATGDLYLAGRGVALGYLDRPAETEAAFPPDPFAAGERMYRTGDRASIRPDGQLRFHGRSDDQVKILGNRIELTEVRRLLESHPAVSAAAVEAAGDPARLIAYVVLTRADPTRDEIVGPLARRLPTAALPARIHAVDALPSTVNGKVDFAALRRTPGRVLAAGGHTPLSSDETWAADLFAQVLGLPAADRAALGPDADFFALGGHSLLAVRMVANVGGSVRGFLQDPTVGGLVRSCAAGGGGAGPSVAEPVEQVHPASPIQAAFYLLDRVPALSPAYLAPSVLQLRADADPAAVRAAVDTVLARHPALRSRFSLDLASRSVAYRTDGTPPTCALVHFDDVAEAERHVRERCWARIDLRAEPPVRAEIVTRAGAAPLLMVTAHHIAVDGLAHQILLQEIETLYGGGEPAELAAPVHPAAIGDGWSDRPAGERDAERAEAVRRLAGAPTDIILPHDRPREGVQGTEGGVCSAVLAPSVTAGLRKLLGATGTTMSMALAAVVAVVLARGSGQRDFLFAYPWAGRETPERAGAVAMLVNTAVLRVRVGETDTWRAVLEGVRAESLASYRTAHVPFAEVAGALAPERDMSRPRLTPVLLSAELEPWGDPGRPVALIERVLPLPDLRVKYELEVTVADRGAEVALVVAYATARFEPSTARHLLASIIAAAAELAMCVDEPTLKGLS
ncbi:non-ribosomal peptide synthetase [Catellatospora methionotrophica]|uniref:non-ribosomal peptide synthetase n=1 Tax=Catellatospora methionotrophica TaxID=121620 RepID=UPI0033CAF37C